MPAPTAYTEPELCQFLVLQLGELAPALAWVPEDPRVQEAVTDALLAYGAATIAAATDIAVLRAHGRVAIWRAVARATAGHYRFGADQMTFDRAQVHEHAVAMLAEAEREAGAAGAGPALVVATVVRDSSSDPYSVHPDQWGVVV